jgi:hypothetical protein
MAPHSEEVQFDDDIFFEHDGPAPTQEDGAEARGAEILFGIMLGGSPSNAQSSEDGASPAPPGSDASRDWSLPTVKPAPLGPGTVRKLEPILLDGEGVRSVSRGPSLDLKQVQMQYEGSRSVFREGGRESDELNNEVRSLASCLSAQDIAAILEAACLMFPNTTHVRMMDMGANGIIIENMKKCLENPRWSTMQELKGFLGILLNHGNVHWTVAFVDDRGVIWYYDPLRPSQISLDLQTRYTLAAVRLFFPLFPLTLEVAFKRGFLLDPETLVVRTIAGPRQQGTESLNQLRLRRADVRHPLPDGS